MPQLIKGGKYVFGWSKVGNDGTIVIPPEAYAEYQFMDYKSGILIPGSKTSGGFGLTTKESLRNSHLASILESCPELANFQGVEGEAIGCDGKTYGWIRFHENSIVIPVNTLKRYGIASGDYVLSVRGSSLALGFLVRGRIVEEAKKHPEIERFE